LEASIRAWKKPLTIRQEPDYKTRVCLTVKARIPIYETGPARPYNTYETGLLNIC